MEKQAIRKLVGRGKFTAQEFAAAREVTAVTARKQLDKAVTEGAVERLEETRKTGKRGRPAFQYRVQAGK